MNGFPLEYELLFPIGVVPDQCKEVHNNQRRRKMILNEGATRVSFKTMPTVVFLHALSHYITH